MGFGRTLILLLAVLMFGFVKHRAVLHTDCTEQNYIQKGKMWRLPQSTGCVIEYGESHCLETKQYGAPDVPDFP